MPPLWGEEPDTRRAAGRTGPLREMREPPFPERRFPGEGHHGDGLELPGGSDRFPRARNDGILFSRLRLQPETGPGSGGTGTALRRKDKVREDGHNVKPPRPFRVRGPGHAHAHFLQGGKGHQQGNGSAPPAGHREGPQLSCKSIDTGGLPAPVRTDAHNIKHHCPATDLSYCGISASSSGSARAF